jgi:glycosyltransferase involved in cell wall biosynthesis
MFGSKKVLVVVVAYDEEQQIGGVLGSIPDFVDQVIVVDDASRDRTAEAVETFAAGAAIPVALERHERNRGSGSAHLTGFRRALDFPFDILVCIDGDGQMNIEDLPKLLAPVAEGQTDVAKANRLLYKDSARRIPRIRFLGNALLTMLTKVASGYWHISDFQTGYFAISRESIEQLVPMGLSKRYGWPNDLIIKMNVRSLRIVDVISRPVYGVGERSRMRIPIVAIPILFRIFVSGGKRILYRYLIYDAHPLLLFYFFGTLFFLIGVSGGLAIWIIDLLSADYAFDYGYMILLSLCIWLGFIMLMFGMLLDRIENQQTRNGQ